MPLSQECINALEHEGFKRWIPGKVCSECGQPAMAPDPLRPHALQEELDKVQQNKTLSAKKKDDLTHVVQRVMADTSRCCGADFNIIAADNYQMLYNSWLECTANVDKEALDKPLTDKHGNFLFPSLNTLYGTQRGPEFTIMQNRWGWGDSRVAALLRIFKEEDTRQSKGGFEEAANAAKEEEIPELTTQEDFLKWMQQG
jgi:hypothetical protein